MRGPLVTVPRMVTVPATWRVAGVNVSARSYQRASHASWFAVAGCAALAATAARAAFHAPRYGATSRSSRTIVLPSGIG